MRHVRATIVAVEKRNLFIFWVWLCSPSFPTCRAHAPYCQMWPAPLCSTFLYYLINGTIFEIKPLNTNCVFWFYLHILFGLASWSSGQGLWLLNHEVPVSIPGSTVGIFPEGEDSHGDHGLGRLVEFRFKGPPGTTSSYITTHVIGTT